MRKTLILLVALVFTLTLTAPVIAGQKQLAESVVFQIGTKEYFVNNQTLGFKMDAAPAIQNGRTYVPVRFLANALGIDGKNIGWESPVVTLSEPGFPVVKLTIGQKEIVVDGEVVATDVAPLIQNDRTMLPARFVAEALGYQVDWRSEQRAVVIWPKGAPKPDIGKVLEHLPSVVTFPDANLEAVVRETINKLTGEITVADLTRLTELKAPGLEIKDLSGLEYAVNLVELDFSCLVQGSIHDDDWQESFNQISDLSPLAGLINLRNLSLIRNPISDLSALSGLANLNELHLHGNQITDIGPLSGLINLTVLGLNGNEISNLSPLAGLTNLTGLYLNGNQITDLSLLVGLTNLTELVLSVNQITDLSPLVGLINLTELDLENNQISDLSALIGLTNLTLLGLDGNPLSSESRALIEKLEARGVCIEPFWP